MATSSTTRPFISRPYPLQKKRPTPESATSATATHAPTSQVGSTSGKFLNWIRKDTKRDSPEKEASKKRARDGDENGHANVAFTPRMRQRVTSMSSIDTIRATPQQQTNASDKGHARRERREPSTKRDLGAINTSRNRSSSTVENNIPLDTPARSRTYSAATSAKRIPSDVKPFADSGNMDEATRGNSGRGLRHVGKVPFPTRVQRSGMKESGSLAFKPTSRIPAPTSRSPTSPASSAVSARVAPLNSGPQSGRYDRTIQMSMAEAMAVPPPTSRFPDKEFNSGLRGFREVYHRENHFPFVMPAEDRATSFYDESLLRRYQLKLSLSSPGNHTEYWDLPKGSAVRWEATLHFTDTEAGYNTLRPPIDFLHILCNRINEPTSPQVSVDLPFSTYWDRERRTSDTMERMKFTMDPSRGIIVRHDWEEVKGSRQCERQWDLKFWVPIPVDLFKGIESRFFRLEVQACVFEETSGKRIKVSGELNGSISCLSKNRNMHSSFLKRA